MPSLKEELHTLNLRVEQTLDGSPTLYLSEIGEHYHSTYGARSESQHVFIKEGLQAWQQRCDNPKTVAKVLEVGFGTGLNALLTLRYASSHGLSVVYHTYEKNPLPDDLVGNLWSQMGSDEDREWMRILHKAPWDQAVDVTPYFTLIKHYEDLLKSELPLSDVIYMDAFSPEKTPELWTESFLQKLFTATEIGGRLSTYCAKGIIRRRLEGCGYTVYRTPGPLGGKREILTADKYAIGHLGLNV